MPRHFSMIRDFHLSDLLTLGNGTSGMAAIFLSIAYVAHGGIEKVFAAAALLVLAVVCDVLDGRVARWRQEATLMGRELDSLADVISFGVAPACLAYAVGFQADGDALALALFVACGISRLARYNATADALARKTGKVTYFEGAPITTSLLLVALIALLGRTGHIGAALPLGTLHFGAHALHPLVLAFVALGCLMISKTIHIPKP
jgi:CDP-diacylglycerol--serine O-phosphatidyltransferase